MILVLGGGFYYFYLRSARNQEDLSSPSTERSGVTGTGDFEVKAVPTASQFPPPPDLNRPILITLSLPDETKKLATDKINDLSAKLKKDPALFNHWLELGRFRKMIGDNEGARQAWEYAGLISPSNYVSFNNLGELYGYYLKDLAKAEVNYKKAVSNGPDQIYLYRNFADFYRFVLKDTAKAKTILEKGIKANPGTSDDLQNLLKQI